VSAHPSKSVGAGAFDGPFTMDIRLAPRQASAGSDICPDCLRRLAAAVRLRRFAGAHRSFIALSVTP